MPVEIRVPPLGESLVDAVVGQWLKGEGDQVSRGETIVELETDKVNLDVTAPEDGVLGKIERNEGDVVTVGEVLGTVSEGAGAAANGAAPQETVVEIAAPSAEPVPAAAAPCLRQLLRRLRNRPQSAMAVARRRRSGCWPASTTSISMRSSGTGPGGRVTREDVLAAVARNLTTPAAGLRKPTPQVAPPAPAPASATGRRQLRHLLPAPIGRCQWPRGAGPHVAPPPDDRRAAGRGAADRGDADHLQRGRHDARSWSCARRRKDAFKEKHGVGLGFMSFFTKAVVGALKAFPRVNAEIQGDEIVLKHYYDIGIAVGTDEGLVVPVVRDADRKTFAEIEKEIGELAVKARDGKLELSDLRAARSRSPTAASSARCSRRRS